MFLCSGLCPFEFCNHLGGEERVDYFTFLSFCCHVAVVVLWLSLKLLWVVGWPAVFVCGIS